MKNILLILSGVAICSALAFTVPHFQKHRIAYVDVPALYNQFEFKKEQEKKLISIRETRKQLLDSLELELKVLVKKIKKEQGKNADDINVFQARKEDYLTRKKAFDEDDQSIVSNMESQILLQLNQYVKDYGKEKGYDMILGAEGSGAVMYADEQDNITEDVKEYINSKYAGK